MRARLLIALVTTATAAASEARDFPPPATIKPSLAPLIERAEHHEKTGQLQAAISDYMLFVQSSRQRGGIGRGLLAAAGALAGEADCEFTVSSSPNAVSAYERLGFRITGLEQCVHGIRFVPMQRLSHNDRNA